MKLAFTKDCKPDDVTEVDAWRWANCGWWTEDEWPKEDGLLVAGFEIVRRVLLGELK